jgi:Tfp pilus assembly protein PilO
MTDRLHQRSMATRVFAEHRGIVIPLVALLAVNVLVYAFFIYPLSQRVSTVAERTQAAESELAAARVERAQASGTLTGKARAAEALQTFYTRVLPVSLASAQRLVYPRLELIAREVDLQHVRTTVKLQTDRDLILTRLEIQMSLTGSYRDIRRFIHELEQASEFVVIEKVTLKEETAEEGDVLNVALELATYYKGAAE